jgi:hypothetical protein
LGNGGVALILDVPSLVRQAVDGKFKPPQEFALGNAQMQD